MTPPRQTKESPYKADLDEYETYTDSCPHCGQDMKVWRKKR